MADQTRRYRLSRILVTQDEGDRQHEYCNCIKLLLCYYTHNMHAMHIHTYVHVCVDEHVCICMHVGVTCSGTCTMSCTIMYMYVHVAWIVHYQLVHVGACKMLITFISQLTQYCQE